MRRIAGIFVVGGLVLAVMAGFSLRLHSWAMRSAPQAPAVEPQLTASVTQLPLSFEPNEGQFDSRVLYAAQSSGGTLFFTQEGLTLALPQFAPGPGRFPDPRARLRKHPALQSVVALRMAFEGANPNPEVAATGQLPGIKNYLIGNDPEKWHTHVPIFGRVAYRNLYPGIDLVFYGGKNGLLEYDLNVSPGADPDRIRFRFEGADRVELDEGDLLIHAGPAELRQRLPHVYTATARREVPASYRIDDQGWIGLDLSKRDARDGLRIDPVLAFSTYLGGSGPGDIADAIAIDPVGSVYVTGQATSIDFPTTDGGFQRESLAVPPMAGLAVSTVTKLDPTGSSLVYSTYIGGTPVDGWIGDVASGVVVTAGGFAYVAGQTGVPDFPVTPGAAQTTFGGVQDGYLLELGPEGDRLIYSTFVGGSDLDLLLALDLDSEGNAYAGGLTTGNHFPTTGTALQPIYGLSPDGNGIFVKLSPDGKQFLYESYLGGSGSGPYSESVNSIKVDANEQPLLLGYTVSTDIPGHDLSPRAFHDGGGGTNYLTRLSRDGKTQMFFTYLGGSGIDFGWDLKVDALGNAWVVGQTGSADYPVTSTAIQKSLANPQNTDGTGPFDAFITALDPAGGLLYSTYLGGNGDDRATGVALDTQGGAHIEGITTSTDLVTMNAIHGEHDESLGLDQAPGNGDMFLAELTIDGGLDLLSYIGGSGSEFIYQGIAGTIALDSSGATYLIGSSSSDDFPVTAHAVQKRNNAPGAVNNMVVVKVVPTPPPATLISLQPNNGPSVGVVVQAQGTNLSLQCELDFGGTPSVIQSATSSQLQVRVQPHACGVVDVTLSCPGSPVFILAGGFTFEGCPDSGPPDAGPVPDAGTPDAGTPDAGSPDAGDNQRPSSGCGYGASSLADSEVWVLGMGLLAMIQHRRRRRNK